MRAPLQYSPAHIQRTVSERLALRVVFAGTPSFAVPALQALMRSSIELVAVYTQPDRPAGRGRRISKSPVKLAARASGLPLRQPLRLDDDLDFLRSLAPDLFAVVAYGQILSAEILNLPRLGCINIHASLLPRWRGAAPIQRAIEAGDRISGITLMRMDQGLDTGDVLRQIETPISDIDSAATLGTRLADLGADALAQLLVAPEAHIGQAIPQNPLQASYAAKLTKEESWLDWTQPAVTLERQIRAYFPIPLARSILLDQLVIVHSATLGSNTLSAAPGTIIGLSQEGIQVQTIDGTINLSTLQLAGRKPVSAKSFVNGFSVRPGQRFSAPKAFYAKR